jgi:PAS domain S-box-containing protein
VHRDLCANSLSATLADGIDTLEGLIPSWGRKFRRSAQDESTERHRKCEKENNMQSEECFRGLSENSMAGEYVLQDGRAAYVNPALARIFGYSPAELIGADPLLVIHPDDRQLVAEKIRGRMAGEFESLHYECRGLRKDGQSIDIEVLGGTTLMLDGRPAIIGNVLDITERKRRQKQLQMLSRAVEQSPASVVITNVNGAIEYVNPKFTRLTGYTLEDVLGKNPRFLKTDLTPASTHQELWATVLSGQEWRGNFVNKKKDGDFYWESASISPIKDAAGVTTHFIAVKEDITERKRAEEALRKAEEEYRRLVAEALEGVFKTSPEGKLLAANPALARMLGYTSAEEVVSSISDSGRQLWLDPKDRVVFTKLLEERGAIRDYECQFLRKDGTLVWLSLNTPNVPGPDGRTLYYEGFFEDITERMRDRNALQEAHSKLAQSVKVLESRTDEITALSQFGRMLQSCLSTEEACRIIKAYCQKLFPAFSGGVYLTAASRNFVQSVTSWGEPEVSETSFAPDDCWALRSGHLNCVEDPSAPAQCRHMSATPGVSYL